MGTNENGHTPVALGGRHTNVAAYCAFGLAGAYFAAGVTFAITPGRPTGPDGILYLAGTAPGWATAL